ncbi:hypothetical protein FF36_04622 [Frankia torreyi]|uniref:Uncharacterized protein n=1 Tax=Frankia torreyi TaxID=1856 RepID=A0A0D8BCJ4_9ACTN|nr:MULTISPECIES: hypothetical protein [Frankia]KJE21117.1 hypothetical protein FF36_04622 [Frankia torreyi]KQM03615.1 hypothetical protein FF86_103722 [Frankia sp. CpI1-P]
MIDESQAREIARALLRRLDNDQERPWSLVEFSQGWIINETGYLDADFVGSLGRVIEKMSGKVMCFPARVPTDRIMAKYESVVGMAKVVPLPQR